MPGLRSRTAALALAVSVVSPLGAAGVAQAVAGRGDTAHRVTAGQSVVSSVIYAADRRGDQGAGAVRGAARRVTTPVAPAVTVPEVPVVTAPEVPAPAAPAAPAVPAPVVPAPVVVTPPAPAAPAATPRSLGVTSFYGDFSRHTNLESLRYVELNAWQADLIPAIKRANPAVKVLVYKDMSSTRSYAVRNGRDDALLPTGVGYAASPASWFLTDTTGARMEWPYEGHWWMDVANASYQQAWLANVSAEVARDGWDGVIIDNAMADPQWYLQGRTIAKYPSARTYAAATESFLAAVGPALQGRGLTVIGNISDASASKWDRWVGYLSGANHEHSFAWNNGTRYGGQDWLNRVEEIERTQAAGKIMTATSAAPDASATTLLTYQRASFLLAWDGGASGSAQMFDLGANDSWSPVTGADLGVPTAARTQVAGGVWKRDYTAGAVLVNPGTTTVTVPLGGTFRTLSGAPVTSVTLAPLTGAMLTR